MAIHKRATARLRKWVIKALRLKSTTDTKNVASIDVDTLPKPSAAHRVFAITELCEQILLQLPIRDLICRVPLISHRFHATLHDSIRLQRALFFKPHPDAIPPNIEVTDAYRREHGLHIVDNPFMNQMWSWKLYEHPRFFAAEASWRRMYATQPPQDRLWMEVGEGFVDPAGIMMNFDDKGHFIGSGEKITELKDVGTIRYASVATGENLKCVEIAEDVEVFLRGRGRVKVVEKEKEKGEEEDKGDVMANT